MSYTSLQHVVDHVDLPQEKLVKYGPEKLSDEELLAIIIRAGRKGEHVLALSKNILKKFSQKNITHATYQELIQFSGIGQTKACQIVAAFELGKRFLQQKPSRLLLGPKDVWEEMKDIRQKKKEHVVIFFLNNRNQEITREIISIGTATNSLVHPREVFEPAVRHLSSQIIIAHNHPSGDLSPSAEDKLMTLRLVEAGVLLGIHVLDHIVVSKSGFLSLRQEGFFPPER